MCCLAPPLCLLQVSRVVSLEVQLVLNHSFPFLELCSATTFTGAAALMSEYDSRTAGNMETKVKPVQGENVMNECGEAPPLNGE